VGEQQNLLDGDMFALSPGGVGVGANGNQLGDLLRAGVATEAALEALDGSKIRIELPRIEYGFTGVIDNASFFVRKAHGGDDNYLAYGPTASVGMRMFHRPPNGKVTIDEYQPGVLTGSFHADLIDEANPGPDEAPIVARTIDGRFLVSSPWRGDEDFAFDKKHAAQAMVQNMLQMTPFAAAPVEEEIEAMGAPPASVCAAGFDEDQLHAMGFLEDCQAAAPAAPAAAAPVCSCACEQRQAEEAIDACQNTCAVAWDACVQPAAKAPIPDDLEVQVQMYRDYLQGHGVAVALQKRLLEAFRQAPAFQRRMMLESYR
jgi:hypothetical protein